MLYHNRKQESKMRDRRYDVYNYRHDRKKKEERRLRRKIQIVIKIMIGLILFLLVGGILFIGLRSGREVNGNPIEQDSEEETGNTKSTEIHSVIDKPKWDVQLLTPNEYSRPQTEMEAVMGVVIHYTGNPGTTAQQNRNYFESLATTGETSVSSHFVIGMEGEIIQCIPLDEVAYASRHRNKDTISIEVCHPTAEGKFNEETYDSLIKLVAWLMVEYDLDIEDVLRHYDVTGKICPRYYVDNEGAWEELQLDLKDYVDENINRENR